MKRYFIFLVILLCSCSSYKGSKESTAYDSIKISFYGSSKDYSTKEKIVITVTDSADIKNLNAIKNESQSTLTFFGAGTKGVVYNIDLVYSDSSTGDKLLINILKDYGMKPIIVYGAGTMFDSSYRNNKLVDYVASIINLDAIIEYEGSLTQKEYEEHILKNDY